MPRERARKKLQRKGREELEVESESKRKRKGSKSKEVDLMLDGRKILLHQGLKLVYLVEGSKGRVRAVKGEVEKWAGQVLLFLVDKRLRLQLSRKIQK